MGHGTRRKWDVVWLTLGALLAGAAAAGGALAGDTERIGNYWTHAALDDTGRAQVVEVIDYDFGPLRRHGILRQIPDVAPGAPITVSSPTAPDGAQTSLGFGTIDLRIGDPDVTIHGRHRYTITYPIDTLVDGDRFSWNAVGLDWQVPFDEVEVHVTAGREFVDLACHRGERGELGGCDVTQSSPGHLVVEVSGLDAGRAVTVEGTLAGRVPSPPALPVPPTGPATDPGSGWLAPGIGSAVAALLAAAITSRSLRRLGKEQVWSGGAADAAFGPPAGTVVGYELIDHEDLADLATIEFAPPRGLSAAAGGIIHAEVVESQHQISWLIECAIRDEVVLLEDGDDLVLARGPAAPHPAVAERLDSLLGDADRVELGSYDSAFSSAWTGLGADLEEWRAASGMWDPSGHRRRTRARVLGTLAMLIGLGGVFVGGLVANRAGMPWIVAVVAAGLLAGAGIAALIRSWELPIRTPEGSARWLQIESFRRFIAGSEARHAEAAAQMGMLRHYTAWAVALGELDHWKDAVEDAAKVPGSVANVSTADFHFVAMTPALSSATAQTYTSPSSSSGGGGGGAGGGGGGGGGGSW